MSAVFPLSNYMDACYHEKIFDPDHYHNNPQFSYEEPSFSKYLKYTRRDDANIVTFKLIAIPAAAVFGVVNVCHHLFLSIVYSLPIPFSHRKLYLKANVYSLARDFQETYGWIITLFNHSVGQFHVEKAQYYKSCYQCFYLKETDPDRPMLEPFYTTLQNLKTTKEVIRSLREDIISLRPNNE